MQTDQKKPKPTLKLLSLDEQDVLLHVSLTDIEPLIWRRLCLSDATSLHQLHLAIQGAFGWSDSHLHSFIIKPGESYSSRQSVFDQSPDETDGNSHRVTVRDLVQRQIKSFRYIYDMGDNWLHKVKIEQVRPKSKDIKTPSCLDGARQAPPEDCGGAVGYEELLEALRDKNHPEHLQTRSWLNQSFDPERFNLRQINTRLKKTLHEKS